MKTIRHRSSTLGVLGALVMLAGACSDDGGTSTSEESDGEPGGGALEFDYGEQGADWGEIEPQCSGSLQSPIDLAEAVDGDVPDPTLDWSSEGLTIENKGHTTEVYVAAGQSSSVLQGEEWELERFHWHEPSEHVNGGDSYDMELHFVHTRTLADGTTENAVLGVLIETGEANPTYDTIWAAQPDDTGAQEPLADVDVTTLLPDDLTTVVYDGSLTTPPCTEGISWNVLTSPVTVSSDQIAAFDHQDSAREVQETNDRPVTSDVS